VFEKDRNSQVFKIVPCGDDRKTENSSDLFFYVSQDVLAINSAF